MQLSKIIVGKWYQTKEGIGPCVQIAGKVRFRFRLPMLNMPAKDVWLTAKDVEYEIPKGEEPHPEEDADQPEEVAKNRLREAATNIKDNCNEARIDLAAAAVARNGASGRLALLKAAMHALRSYQFGNTSPLLAEQVADAIDEAIGAS